MKHLILLTLILFAGLLMACGGGGGQTNEPAATTLNVAGYDDFRFEPANVSAPAGSQVTVNFDNAGVLEHSWVLVESQVDPLVASEDDALAGASSGIVSAGGETTFSFTSPPAGVYTVVCTVPGHAAGGMVGVFTSQ
jgi:plastocyanin